MLINREVLSIPPHISTSWMHVVALYMEESTLVVSLKDGIIIKIPQLQGPLLEEIFDTHAAFLTEKKENSLPRPKRRELEPAAGMELPLRFGVGFQGLPFDSMMANGMQHNPDQANMPDIPKEILNKIVSITKIISPVDTDILSKGEPHCNCAYCQISKAIHGSLDHEERFPAIETSEEEKEELAPWIVEPLDACLYGVKKRANPAEEYKVFIKDGQVGCNCGSHGCEHIIAVLRS